MLKLKLDPRGVLREPLGELTKEKPVKSTRLQRIESRFSEAHEELGDAFYELYDYLTNQEDDRDEEYDPNDDEGSED